MSSTQQRISKVKPGTSSFWSVGIISVLFIGAYFVLRALPDAQCGFLHYEEIRNADGEIELCATNHAGFIDLTRFKYPIATQLEIEEIDAAGVLRVGLNLETSGGMSIAPYELAVTHTKKMHVMLIDASLQDYHHVHPEPDGLNGRYTFEFSPASSGAYRVFTEIVPLMSRQQAIATGTIPVSGSAGTPGFSKRTESSVDGVQFELVGVPATIRTGQDYKFNLNISAENGAPVALEMIMGAKGHMVAFDAAGKGFAHMHPVDSIVASRAGLTTDSKEGELAFMFNVPNPGWYRIFAQVQIAGQEVYGPFDLYVD